MNVTPHKLHQAALLLDTCHPAPGGARYMSSVTIEMTLHGHSPVSSCHVPRATRVTGEEEGNYRLLNIIWRRQWSVWGPSLPSQQLLSFILILRFQQRHLYFTVITMLDNRNIYVTLWISFILQEDALCWLCALLAGNLAPY